MSSHRQFAIPPRHSRIAIALSALVACGWAQAQADQVMGEITVKSKYEREDLPVRAPGNKAASGARLGILGATSIMEAPVHVNAYTRELAEDWSALTLQDVLENDSAVVFTTNKNHMLQNFNLRGLDMGAQDIAFNGLYGISPANSVPIEMFERVEVLRGPNVLLSGMPPASSVAGTVNMVTKRALTTQRIADLTLTWASKSYAQAHLDVGDRLGAEKRFGIRFNGVYGTGEMGAKSEEQTRRVGALALDYVGDRARFSLDIYNSQNKIEDGSPGMFNFMGNAAIPGVGYLLRPPKGDTNMFRGTHGSYESSGLLARAEFDFNQDWQGYFAVGGANIEGKGLMFGTRAYVTGADGTTRGAVYHLHRKIETRTAEAGVIGKFATGAVKHRLQLTANILKNKDGTANNACNYCYVTNMYDPVVPPFPSAPVLNGFGTENDFRSFAVADTMSFADEMVLLTLGARHQTVKMPTVGGRSSNYSESRVSPMLGVVVRPWGDRLSLFGNYTEGLEPGQTVGVGYANTGDALPPKQTKQFEMGVKVQTGALTHTLSAFEIKQPSFIADTASNKLVDDGEKRLRGVEWSAYGMLTENWALLGGITHIKSEQCNTGKDSFGSPKLRARIGLEWQTPVQGLKVGGRYVYTGKQWADSGNNIRVPSWNRLDLNAGYATKFGATPVRFNAGVENVTDKKYWIGIFGDGFVMPGAPRTFKVSATVSF